MNAISVKARRVLRRRAWILLVAIVLASISGAVIASGQETTYTTRAVLAVPVFDNPGDGAADDDLLGRPLDASRLALTYASIIEVDVALLDVVSRETGQEFDDLSDVITVRHLDDTPLIEVFATASDPEMSALVVESLVSAVTATDPVSTSIAPGSIEAVRFDPPEASTTTGTARALLAGIVLGAAVGTVTVVFWERSQPRVDTAPELTALVGVPARDAETFREGAGTWILQRWVELSRGGRVLLVGRAPRSESDLTSTGLHLADGLEVRLGDGPDDGHRSEDHASEHEPRSFMVKVPHPAGANPGRTLKIDAMYAPANGTMGIAAPFRPGLVVMAVERGTLASEVMETAKSLSMAGMAPRWAILYD